MKQMPVVPKNLKIALSAIFVVLIAAFVVRGCLPRRAIEGPPVKKTAPAVPAKKKIPAPQKPAAVSPPPSGARIAIILDDWGNNETLVAAAVAVDRPLTLAILPKLKHSQEIAEEAHKAGLGVMLHMPMEPKGRNSGLEPHTIMTGFSDAEVLQFLDEAVASIPHLEGVNNHMGSAATSDPRIMRLVLGRLKEKGLFFVDSHTISTTVAPEVAGEVGARFMSRNIFIDNVVTLGAVKAQLRIAQKYALKHGSAVVIGHDKKITLQAILEMVPELEAAGIKLVYARDLVR
jgi:hypothetical protein